MHLSIEENIGDRVIQNQQKIAEFLLLVLLFGYPLSSFITAFSGLSSNVLSIIARGFQVLVVFFYLLFILAHRLFVVYRSSLYVFLLFWALYLPRLFYDIQFYESQLGIDVNQYVLVGVVLSFILTIPLFAYCEFNEKRLEKWILIITTLLVYMGLFFALNSEDAFITRVGGNEKLNPITTGAVAVLSIGLSFKWIVERRVNLFMQLLLFLNIGLGCILLILVSTKSMILVLALFLIVIIAQQKSPLALRSLFLVAVFVGSLTIFALVSGSAEIFELTYFRFVNLQDDQSSLERLDMLKGAVEQFTNSPILGDFIEERTLNMYPHNVVLEAFMATGIAGGIVFTLLFASFVMQTIKLTSLSKLGIVSMLAIVQIVLAMVSSSICFSPEMWYMIAVVSSKSLNPIQQDVIRSSSTLNIIISRRDNTRYI